MHLSEIHSLLCNHATIYKCLPNTKHNRNPDNTVTKYMKVITSVAYTNQKPESL